MDHKGFLLMAVSDPTPYFQYEHESGVVARWHGGAYIELGYLADDEFSASDVINVWNYRDDVPRIERTLDAFRLAVDERIAELDEEEGRVS